MADETLRLRTVVVSDEAIANIRAIGREFQMLPRQAERGLQQVNREFQSFGNTIRSVGTGLRAAMPGLGAFSLGAAGVGLAANQVVRGLGEVSKSIVELRHTSKELGLSTQQIRGFTVAAEKAGIAPQAMMQGMAAFRRNTEDFAMRIGSVRQEMQDAGFGRLLGRINAASTEMDKYKEAWDFAEVLGRNSTAAKRLFDMLGIGADKLRFSWEEIKDNISNQPIISEKQMADAKRYNDLLVDMDRSFQNLKQRETLKFFDKLEEDKVTVQSFINKVKELHEWIVGKPGQTSRSRSGGSLPMPEVPDVPAASSTGGFFDWGRGRGGGRTQGAQRPPSFQGGGVFTGGGGSGSLRGGADQDILRGSDATLTKAYREGTFQGLVQYASYAQASARVGGGGLGSGSVAGGGGGGGAGGAGYTGGLGGSGRGGGGYSPSGQTPSDAQQAGQVPGQGSTPAVPPGPLPGMPAVPGVPGTVPGVGTGGPLGLPATPGAPVAAPGAAPGAPAGAAPGAVPAGQKPSDATQAGQVPGQGSAPGQGGPDGGPGGGSALAADRARFKQELDANPALRDKVLRIAANEQGKHGQGTQAVLETMMNRASFKGTTLAAQAKWTGERGYYEQGNMGRGALENAQHRAVLEGSLDKTLRGGNITDYATDNASAGLAAKRKANKEMNWTKDYGGESFFQPGRVSGSGNVQKYAAWRQRMGQAAPQMAQAPQAIPALPPPRDPSVTPSEAEQRGTAAPQQTQANANGAYGGRVIEEQAGKTRDKPIQPRLRTALDYASAQTGLTVRVGSGGQIEGRDPHLKDRPGGWTGSHRHDLGHAADFRLYDKEGKPVPINDPRHIAFAEHAARAGAGGGGSGYMGGYTSHIDLGNKGGTYERNAAYNAAIHRGVAARRMAGGALPPPPTRRIDVANDARAQHPVKTGNVGVEVKHNGTEAEATAKTDGELFKKQTVTHEKSQMAEQGTAGP